MTDILLNDDLELRIENGDFVIGDSTIQNQKLLIISDKTQFKENPMRCVGAMRFLEDINPDALAREIRQEFISDGMNVNKIKIDNEKQIAIDANYPQ